MPINAEIKRKEPRFKQDRPKHYIVVSGPVELFNPAMERFMFLQGMNAMTKSGDYAIWSTKPAIGAPPIYLAALLEKKYGVKLKLASQRMGYR